MKYLLLAVVVLIMSVLSGCSDTMRFPPTETQRQSAYLGYEANADIYSNGTEPQSTKAVTALQSSQASLSYIGMPKTIPSIEAAPAVNQTAIEDGSKRPTPEETFNYWLALGSGIAGIILAGTPLGIKVSNVAAQLKDISNRYSAIKSGVNKTLAETPPDESKVLYQNIGEARKQAGVS